MPGSRKGDRGDGKIDRRRNSCAKIDLRRAPRALSTWSFNLTRLVLRAKAEALTLDITVASYEVQDFQFTQPRSRSAVDTNCSCSQQQEQTERAAPFPWSFVYSSQCKLSNRFNFCAFHPSTRFVIQRGIKGTRLREMKRRDAEDGRKESSAVLRRSEQGKG